MKYERCPYCAYNTLDLDSHLKSHNKVREFLNNRTYAKGWDRSRAAVLHLILVK